MIKNCNVRWNKKFLFFIYLILLFFSIFFKTNLFKSMGSSLFDFSGIFLLLIIYLFGRKIGYLTSIVVILGSVFFYNHSFFEFIYVLEIVFIFEIWRKTKLNLILVDIIFWFSVIAPFILIINLTLGNVNNYEIYDFILIVMNSLIDIFIVEILVTYLIRENIFRGKFKIDLKDVVLHIIVGIILIPFSINVYIDVLSSYEYIYKINSENGENFKLSIERFIRNLSDEELLDLKLENSIEIENLKKEIEKISGIEKNNIYILDELKSKPLIEVGENKINEKFDFINIEENQYKIVIKKNNNVKIGYNLDESYIAYIGNLNNTEFKIVILTPMNLYRVRIIQEHISQIKFLLLFVLFIIAFLFLINKTVFKNLAKISENTRNLPNKIKFNRKISWPSSSITEISLFIDNIKTMSKEMENTFNKLNNSQHKLFNLAYYDSLTNLENRLAFKTNLEEIAESEDGSFAIMLLDVDKFKSINDTLGHTMGDKLLIRVAHKLGSFINSKVNVYRIGGDEFTVVVKNSNKEYIKEISNSICNLLKEEIVLEGKRLNIKCSLGISMYPKDSNKVENVLKFADIAMYESKKKDLGLPEFFNNEMMEKVDRRALFEKKLRKAFDNNEVTLFMQPKISTIDERIRGYECLMRWTSEEMKKINMEELISFAEESNIIYELDTWVIKEGCRINKSIQENLGLFVPVSVNVSGKHFMQNELINVITKALEENNLKGEFLKVEVTESVFIEDVNKAISNMQKIKSLGVKISMDDFGKGYSSLTQLMQLPIDELKIDRDFIREVNKDNKKKNIVKLIVNTAKELGLSVVAEGVENKEELQFVINSSCDEVQGYYYSKPLNKDDFYKYIIKSEKKIKNKTK